MLFDRAVVILHCTRLYETPWKFRRRNFLVRVGFFVKDEAMSCTYLSVIGYKCQLKSYKQIFPHAAIWISSVVQFNKIAADLTDRIPSRTAWIISVGSRLLFAFAKAASIMAFGSIAIFIPYKWLARSGIEPLCGMPTCFTTKLTRRNDFALLELY